MKGKIIIPKNAKNSNLLSIIISLILGIILITNSNSIVTIAFQIIGVIISIFGIYRFITYFNIKKQFKTEDTNALISGIISIAIGLLTIFLASVLEIGLRYILGFFILLSGINKLNLALTFMNTNKNFFYTNLIESLVLLLIGLYTIFFANAALVFIGFVLILSAIFDFFKYFTQK